MTIRTSLVAALFLAGIVPGILVGVGLMVTVRLLADKYDLPKAERIVTRGQSLTTLEDWVSKILLRINVAGLLIALYHGIFALLALAGVAKPAFNNWLVFLALLPIAHVIVVALRSTVTG